MTWLRRSIGIAALVVAIGACGKARDAGPPADGTGIPGATRGSRSSGTVGTRPAATPPSAVPAVCAAVFPPAEVARILGVDGLETPRAASRPPAGTGFCALERKDGRGAPVALATVLIDCRPSRQDIATRRGMARAMAAQHGSYHDVDLGKGGAYTDIAVLGKPVYTVFFAHATVPCTATVATELVADDHVLELARLVSDRLTEADYPRP